MIANRIGDAIEKTLKEMGVKDTTPRPKLTFTKSNLPPNTQVHAAADGIVYAAGTGTGGPSGRRHHPAGEAPRGAGRE